MDFSFASLFFSSANKNRIHHDKKRQRRARVLRLMLAFSFFLGQCSPRPGINDQHMIIAVSH